MSNQDKQNQGKRVTPEDMLKQILGSLGIQSTEEHDCSSCDAEGCPARKEPFRKAKHRQYLEGTTSEHAGVNPKEGNVKHYRFREFDSGSEEYSVSNTVAMSVCYTNPQLDLSSSKAYIDVGVSICNGDNFDRAVGRKMAHARMLDREDPMHIRIQLRERIEAGELASVRYDLIEFSRSLATPEGRRMVHESLRDVIYNVCGSKFFPTTMKQRIANDDLILVKEEDAYVSPSVQVKIIDLSSILGGKNEQQAKPVFVSSLEELVKHFGKPTK